MYAPEARSTMNSCPAGSMAATVEPPGMTALARATRSTLMPPPPGRIALWAIAPSETSPQGEASPSSGDHPRAGHQRHEVLAGDIRPRPVPHLLAQPQYRHAIGDAQDVRH